jgi:hypothetical protein
LRITLPPNIAPPNIAPPSTAPPNVAQPNWGPSRPNSPPPWNGGSALRWPGGLIPAGPPRPIYREPLPARFGPIMAGAGVAGLWLLLFGLLATTARGYAWLTFGSGAVAWLAALVLARFGDRGVAIGVAISAAVGVAIAGIVVTAAWSQGHWLLW